MRHTIINNICNQKNNNNNSNNNHYHNQRRANNSGQSCSLANMRQATMKSINNSKNDNNLTNQATETTNLLKAMTNHKSSIATFTSPASTTDKDSNQDAAKLLINLLSRSMAPNSTVAHTSMAAPAAAPSTAASTSSASPATSTSISTNSNSSASAKLLATTSSSSKSTSVKSSDHAELRNLELWHDEDGDQQERKDESYYQELVDPSNANGWSADEMFRYNEKIHKIHSNYNDRTLSDNYTMPLPKINSKATMRMATQLAKEIEDRVIADGRVTPESSDDDEIFETERMHRIKLKQQKQLDQLKKLQHQLPQHQSQHHYQFVNHNGAFSERDLLENNGRSTIKTTKKSSFQCSQNSSETPATISLSSSPTLTDIIKPVTSSSRNILRTCLT